MVKRGKLEIIRDILRIIQDSRNSIKPTPLLRKSNLSSKIFKTYYMELIEKKLIQVAPTRDNEIFISLTEKGFKFLERYHTIIDFIEEFEL